VELPGALEADAVIGTGRRRLLLGALALWAALTIFSRLGGAPVYIINEGREGVYVRAMLDTGDWILPSVPNHVECGETIPDKPPLFHWIAVAATGVRGALASGRVLAGSELSRRFDEWTLRSPSAIAGVLMTLAVAVLGARLIGERAALLGAATLPATWQFVQQATYGRVDMVFATCAACAILLAGVALTSGARAALVGTAAFAGLAVLAKGPLGLVLPGFAAGCWVALRSLRARSLGWLQPLPWLAASAVLVSIVVPWYGAALLKGGMALVRSHFLTENVGQFFGEPMPLTFYVTPWLADSFPWNLAAAASAWQALRRRRPGAEFLAVAWIAVLAFFEIASYKRRAYLLPAIPLAAMLAGVWLDDRLPGPASRRTEALSTAIGRALARLPAWSAPAAAVCLAIATVGTLAALVTISGTRFPDPLYTGAATIVGAAATLLAGAWLVHAVRTGDRWLTFAALLVALSAACAGPFRTAQIGEALTSSPKPFVDRVVATLPPGEVVSVRGLGDDPSLLLLLYFPFPDRIVVVPQAEPHRADLQPGLHLLGPDEWTWLQSRPEFPASGWRELWADVLRGRGLRVPLVLAQRSHSR